MKNAILDYLKDDNFEEENESDRANVIKSIRDINLQLSMSGFDEIGDLFDNSIFSVSKTVSTIHSVLSDRQKALESKAEINQKYTKLDYDNLTLLEKIENSKEKVNEQININNSFKNKIKSIEIKHLEEIEKIKAERDDYLKAFNRIVQKENQYKHEIKKLEKDNESNKIKMNKLLSDKKQKSDTNLNASGLNVSAMGAKSMNNTFISSNINTGVISNMNISENLRENLHLNTNSQKEFYNLINKAFNDKINLVVSENEQLRECLKIIYKEIYQYIDFKKLILLKFTKDVLSQSNFKDISEQINNKSILKPEIFNLNFDEVRDQIYNSFNDTLIIFRKYLIYDILKVDPQNEFELEQNSNILKNNKFDYDSIPYFQELKTIFDSKNKELQEMNKNEAEKLKNFNVLNFEENLNPFAFVFSEGKDVTANSHDKIESLIEKIKVFQKKYSECEVSIQSFDQKLTTLSSSIEEDSKKRKSNDEINIITQKIRERCAKIIENFDN